MIDNNEKCTGENPGEVKINVGGTIFQTSLLTLTKLDNTMLSAMVKDHWWNQELFIDRDPTHFAKVLNYLRDGENFALPLDEEAREALRKEADFYNIPGLVKICSGEIKVGDKVQWKDSVIEGYWKYLVSYLYAYRLCSSETKLCMACACYVTGYVGPSSQTQTKLLYNQCSSEPSAPSINYEEWTLLKNHMRTMKGTVVEKLGIVGVATPINVGVPEVMSLGMDSGIDKDVEFFSFTIKH